MNSRFLDEDALAVDPARGRHDPSAYQTQHHTTKHKQRNKGLEIVFDPQSHKDYVTGFRKRKQQRRKEALKKLEKKQRQQRVEERAERKQAIRQQLGLDDEPTEDRDGQTERPTQRPRVQVFHSSALISTVTVEPIAGDSDEEAALHEHAAEGRDGSAAADVSDAQQKHGGVRFKGANSQSADAGTDQQPTRLSKTSLRIMTKTKQKLGKESKSSNKARGGGSRKESKSSNKARSGGGSRKGGKRKGGTR